MKHFFLCLLVTPLIGFAQTTVGPLSANTGADNPSIGTVAWTSAGNVTATDNTYATVAAGAATTHRLVGRNFGFTLVNTDVIAGIRLEVEKSHTPNPVAINGVWSIGNSKTTPVTPGVNRVFIVVIGMENSDTRDVTNVTYGGVAMTQINEVGLGTPTFHARTEAWYLNESQLALLANNTSYAINVTYAGALPIEFFDIVGSAFYNNVDQLSPFITNAASSITAGSATYTHSPAFTVGEGSVSIYNMFCGAQVGSVTTAGSGTSGYTINSGFAEMIDYYNCALGFGSSGGALLVATKSQATAGTEAPQTVFNGSPNRRTIIALNLRRARNMDNNVQLLKNGTITGNNYATTLVDWPTTDAYSAYGSISDLWGTTWIWSDINNANFGGSVSAIMQNNGSVRVDHIRMTVFKTSILPVELVSFNSKAEGRTIGLNWVTASERDLDYFTVERSADGMNFEPVGKVSSEGPSEQARYYSLVDESPLAGINYYRLRMTDKDGTTKFSDIVAENLSIDANVSVYPNPTSDWAHILLEGTVDEIIISDAKGTIIDRVEGTTIDNSVDLNLYDMPDGVYFVCVKSASGTTVKRIAKESRMN